MMRAAIMRGDRTRGAALALLAACALVAWAACGGDRGGDAAKVPTAPTNELLPPEAFDVVRDDDARSRALFLEATKVMFHPRCKNCHPAGDVPVQGDLGHAHDPPVVRGEHDHGVPGLTCDSCHQDHNLELARVPGAPKWHLAPREMSWVDKTPHTLCEQLKDPARNGHRSLAEIIDHSAHDELVAWGWKPGHDRVPAPGTQERFGALLAAWERTGAKCPEEKKR